MITAILLLLGGGLMTVLLGAILIADAVRHAPEGLEGEDGFHAVSDSVVRTSQSVPTSDAIGGTPALS